MTRTEAAEKVAKLDQLSRGTSNRHESDSARKQAARLREQYGLNEVDLQQGQMSAAFDDLVTALEQIVLDNPAMPPGLFGTDNVLRDVMAKIRNLGDSDKATRLRQVAVTIRTVAFISGNKYVKQAKSVLDVTLKNHDVTI